MKTAMCLSWFFLVVSTIGCADKDRTEKRIKSIFREADKAKLICEMTRQARSKAGSDKKENQGNKEVSHENKIVDSVTITEPGTIASICSDIHKVYETQWELVAEPNFKVDVYHKGNISLVYYVYGVNNGKIVLTDRPNRIYRVELGRDGYENIKDIFTMNGGMILTPFD